ncbi:Uncharacterised protein [uncultured archaeon]|nr:Uncharacterised protein [uncultured archaeon]
MSEIALAKINNFASSKAKQAEVPTTEEPIFVLTGTQLQDLISRAVLPLQADLQDLKDTIALLEEKIATLEATQDLQAENSFIQLQLINDLRNAIHKEPQPLQKDRGEILRALIAANDGKMLRAQARKKMHLSESRFSELLAVMDDYIEVKPYHLNRNLKVLVLK